MGKHSQENAKLKIKLRAEKISRAELQAENQSILDAFRAMKQSLVEHENFIVELQRESEYHNVMHERAIAEAEGDREAWKTQCLARQLYIRHTLLDKFIRLSARPMTCLRRRKHSTKRSSLLERTSNVL